jgi:hypothetical protein
MKTKKQIKEERDRLVADQIAMCSKKYRKFTKSDFTPRVWGQIKALTWVLGEAKSEKLKSKYKFRTK